MPLNTPYFGPNINPNNIIGSIENPNTVPSCGICRFNPGTYFVINANTTANAVNVAVKATFFNS